MWTYKCKILGIFMQIDRFAWYEYFGIMMIIKSSNLVKVSDIESQYLFNTECNCFSKINMLTIGYKLQW